MSGRNVFLPEETQPWIELAMSLIIIDMSLTFPQYNLLILPRNDEPLIIGMRTMV